MGRLIDSDNLRAQIEAHEIIKKFSITEYECGYNVGLCLGIDEVDEAETVEAIPITYLTSRIVEFRAKDTYANQFAADFLQAIINEYNKEKDNEQTK